MDELDFKIAEILAKDGRKSYREIARLLMVSEPTIRQRVKRMIESKKIFIKAFVNIDEFPDILIAYIGIKQVGNANKCLEMLSEIPEVIYTVNTIGRYDLIAVMAVSSREKLADILTNKMCEIGNSSVLTTETHIVLYNKDLLVPAENIIYALQN